MTAVTNVADTVTLSYQWQQKTGDVWSNVWRLDSSPQKTVTSTSRGTSAYRVVVRHSSGASVESSPTYVTWNEWEIVVEMLRAVDVAVTALTEFGTAQTALLNCVERRTGTRHASFDAVLAQYTGATKTAVDACEDAGAPASSDARSPLSATDMFDTYRRLYREELTTLKTANAEYAALLETDYAGDFERNAGAANIIRLYATRLASESTATSTDNTSGASGSAGTLRTGFNCLIGTAANPTLEAKL